MESTSILSDFQRQSPENAITEYVWYLLHGKHQECRAKTIRDYLKQQGVSKEILQNALEKELQHLWQHTAIEDEPIKRTTWICAVHLLETQFQTLPTPTIWERVRKLLK